MLCPSNGDVLATPLHTPSQVSYLDSSLVHTEDGEDAHKSLLQLKVFTFTSQMEVPWLLPDAHIYYRER